MTNSAPKIRSALVVSPDSVSWVTFRWCEGPEGDQEVTVGRCGGIHAPVRSFGRDEARRLWNSLRILGYTVRYLL